MLFTAITGVAALGVFNTRTTLTGCRRQQSGIGIQSGIPVEPIRNTHGSFGKCRLDLGVTALRRCSEADPARNPRSSEQKTASGERPLSGARILPGEGRDEALTGQSAGHRAMPDTTQSGLQWEIDEYDTLRRTRGQWLYRSGQPVSSLPR